MMSTFPASLLILNGKGANEPQLREAVNLLRDEGIDIHVRVTWEKGDAARFIDEALQLNVETVIAGRSAAALYSYPYPEQADEHAAAGRCAAAHRTSWRR